MKNSKARTKSGTTPGNRKYSASRDDFGQRTTVVSQPGKAYVKRTFYTGRKDKFVIEPGKKAPKSTWGPGPTKKLNKTKSNKN